MAGTAEHGDAPTGERKLGDFTLVEQIGRGGMGLVYRARQDSLDRMVAIKILPGGSGLDPEAVARFRREAEAAGRLNHPGIVPIYAVGESEGVHFYAMELVEGPSLQAVLLSLSGRDPRVLAGSLAEEAGLVDVYPQMRDREVVGSLQRHARSCAALIADIANALAAAHAAHVIHRDIKPSNILIHPAGRAVVVDFGLARDAATSGQLTRTGDAVGTPAYMAPEQAAGRSDLDARVDIYALGATLYQLLTLRPPFDGEHGAEIMRRILEEDPVWVRRLNSRVPQDLAAIVHCCLAKDPNRRYATARDLEGDLRSYLAGLPVTVRAPFLASRWLRRHGRRVKVAGLAAASALLAVGFGGFMLREDSTRRGEEALEQARLQVVAGPSPRLEEAYGRAAALLGTERVLVARRGHLAEVFPTHYSGGRYAVLSGLLAAIPRESWDEAERRFERRLAGRGTLELRGLDEQATVEYRLAVDASRGADEWRPLPEDRELPIGDVLVRAASPGFSTVVFRARVERDRATTIDVFLRPSDEVPAAMVLVAAAEDGNQALGIGRTEVTAESYAALLRGVDSALREELLPAGWAGPYSPGDPAQPVVGLSFHQARAAAALLGGHLPSAAEYQRAGTVGLETWAFPWGPQADPARVAADPAHLDHPTPADSLPSGASPVGVLHLVGNAAEFLSAFHGEPLQLAGGHFGSDPGAISLATREIVVDSGTSRPYSGMRLSRFLPGRDGDGRAPEAADGGRWTLDAQGRVSLRYRTSQDGPVLRPALPGFDLVEERPIAARERLLVLRPVTGLHGSGDGYVLELPVWFPPGRDAVHELQLPLGTAVEESSPPPDGAFQRAGRRHLWWRGRGGERTGPIWLRLRKDGPLTGQWPVQNEVRQSLARFFEAWSKRDRSDLERFTTRSFRYLPARWERSGTRWNHTEQPDEKLLNWRVVDCTVVGEVVTVELLVDWHPRDRSGGGQQFTDWALQVQMLHAGGLYLVHRVAPSGGCDLGWSDGTRYRYERLGLEVEVPDDVRMARTVGAQAEVQLLCVPASEAGRVDPDVQLRVLAGAFAPDETDEAAMHRLTAGAAAAAPGEVRTGRRTDILGDERRGTAYPAQSVHWLFREGENRFRRERWTRLQVGQRRFLLQAVTRASSRQEAEERFSRWQAWFDRVLTGVHVR